MARDFNGSNQYLWRAAVVTAYPVTMACWFNLDNATGVHGLVVAAENTSSGDFFGLYARGDQAGDPLEAITKSTAAPRTSTGYTASTWHHGCAVFAASNDRRIYLDAGGKVTDNTNYNVLTIDETAIGALSRPTPVHYTDGRIAEVGIWNVALTDAEVAILAKGVSPLMVRPGSLVAYWPLVGRTSPEIDLKRGAGMTLVNSPAVADHPRVLRPSTLMMPSLAAGGGGPGPGPGDGNLILSHPAMFGGGLAII